MKIAPIGCCQLLCLALSLFFFGSAVSACDGDLADTLTSTDAQWDKMYKDLGLARVAVESLVEDLLLIDSDDISADLNRPFWNNEGGILNIDVTSTQEFKYIVKMNLCSRNKTASCVNRSIFFNNDCIKEINATNVITLIIELDRNLMAYHPVYDMYFLSFRMSEISTPL